MPIQEQNIVFVESQVMDDVPEGGGAATGRVIVDGQMNNVFEDISDLDRAYGRFNLRKLFLAVRNERASENYNTEFLANMLTEEGKGQFDVRQAILGHIQQGGSPTPFDRLLATRLVSRALNLFDEGWESSKPQSWYLGLSEAQVAHQPLAHMMEHIDPTFRRPLDQWWLQLQDVFADVAYEPSTPEHSSL